MIFTGQNKTMSDCEEIRSHNGYVLNTKTGIVTYEDRTKQFELTGEPLMISESVVSVFFEIHYIDHIDRFSIYESDHDPIIDDPTYLGTCYECIGSCSYHRVGNDLVCENNTRADFFLGCQKLLYVTNYADYNNDEYILDYLPHYVDLEGNIHGRDPIFTVKN